MNENERCPECGSWGEECAFPTAQPGCGCARCLRAQRDEARAEVERLRWLAELLEALEALLADHDKYCEHGSFESADAARAAIAKVRATEGDK